MKTKMNCLRDKIVMEVFKKVNQIGECVIK